MEKVKNAADGVIKMNKECNETKELILDFVYGEIEDKACG